MRRPRFIPISLERQQPELFTKNEYRQEPSDKDLHQYAYTKLFDSVREEFVAAAIRKLSKLRDVRVNTAAARVFREDGAHDRIMTAMWHLGAWAHYILEISDLEQKTAVKVDLAKDRVRRMVKLIDVEDIKDAVEQLAKAENGR